MPCLFFSVGRSYTVCHVHVSVSKASSSFICRSLRMPSLHLVLCLPLDLLPLTSSLQALPVILSSSFTPYDMAIPAKTGFSHFVHYTTTLALFIPHFGVSVSLNKISIIHDSILISVLANKSSSPLLISHVSALYNITSLITVLYIFSLSF